MLSQGTVYAAELGNESGPFGHVHCGEKLAGRLPCLHCVMGRGLDSSRLWGSEPFFTACIACVSLRKHFRTSSAPIFLTG